MDRIWDSIVRNSLWTVMFGILLIALGIFIYKKRFMKQLPAWFAMLLCLAQCLGKVVVSVLYGECFKNPSNSYRLIQSITFVSNTTEIVTSIIILGVLIWCIRCLGRKRDSTKSPK